MLGDELELFPGYAELPLANLPLGVAQADIKIRFGKLRPHPRFQAGAQGAARSPVPWPPFSSNDNGFSLIHEAIKKEAQFLTQGRPGGFLLRGRLLGAQ